MYDTNNVISNIISSVRFYAQNIFPLMSILLHFISFSLFIKTIAFNKICMKKRSLGNDYWEAKIVEILKTMLDRTNHFVQTYRMTKVMIEHCRPSNLNILLL